MDYAAVAGEDWYSIYPAEQPRQAPSTEDTISTFLDTYGSQSPEDDAMLERLIFSPAPADYFAVDDDPDAPLELPAELRPASFNAPEPEKDSVEKTVAEEETIPETPPAEEKPRPRPQKAAQPSEDSLLSESLAKIFIKQGRYERAFEIISNLSLKFPEKSIYFADQLRFLQKLIINRASATPQAEQ